MTDRLAGLTRVLNYFECEKNAIAVEDLSCSVFRRFIIYFLW